MHPLRKARIEKGMSAVDLACELHIDASLVRHVEAGRIAPYPRFRKRCSEILGVPEEDLFGERAGEYRVTGTDQAKAGETTAR